MRYLVGGLTKRYAIRQHGRKDVTLTVSIRSITPRWHQDKRAEVGYALLREHGLAYDVSQERTGKSLPALMIFERSSRKTCLIVTKKKAIPDWVKLTLAYPIADKRVFVINYDSIHKIPDWDWDFAIIDEAHHALSAYPKPSKTFLRLAHVVYGLPLLYLSATPHAETTAQLYHQLRLSAWSPFNGFKNFYAFHKEYGLDHIEYLGARQIKMYDKMQEERVLKLFTPITYGVTREEINFKQPEAHEVLHVVPLEESTLNLYNTLAKDRVAEVDGHEVLIESAGALYQKQCQVVGGTLKIDNGWITPKKKDYINVWLGNTEKIDYIKRTWGDLSDMVIMYQYKEEEHLLKAHFKNAQILQGDTWAEGISLKHIKYQIIYSMSWRTSKYIQRKVRQADEEREEKIEVHIILADGELRDFDVYQAVAIKGVNFNQRYYYGV